MRKYENQKLLGENRVLHGAVAGVGQNPQPMAMPGASPTQQKPAAKKNVLFNSVVHL